jgi:hypothetical protein
MLQAVITPLLFALLLSLAIARFLAGLAERLLRP